MISYRTAYLKAHYPREYFAALLNSVQGNLPKMAGYISECSKLGIHVTAPSINRSMADFHVNGDDIVFGLLALKNVSRQFAENVVRQRETGSFTSFDDFVRRMSEQQLNRRQLEALIKVGAFDELGISRTRLLAAYETILEGETGRRRNNVAGQLDMFSSEAAALPGGSTYSYPDAAELSLRDKLAMEKEMAGIYLSGHPLDGYTDCMAELGVAPLTDISASTDIELDGGTDGNGSLHDGSNVMVAGMITDVSVKTTKKDERMAFVKLEDGYAELECIVFPKPYQSFRQLLIEDSPVCVEGRLQLREGEPPRIVVSTMGALIENGLYRNRGSKSAAAAPSIAPTAGMAAETDADMPLPAEPMPGSADYYLRMAQEAAPTPPKKAPANGGSSGASPRVPRLFLRVPDMESHRYKKCINLIELFEGVTPVTIYDSSTSTYHTQQKGMNVSEFLIDELRELIGAENVVFRR